jgi:hypothetical protein
VLRPYLVGLCLALTGCAWLHSAKGPTVAQTLDPHSGTWQALADTGQTALLGRSEITAIAVPAAPAAYWACLHTPEHRAWEAQEARRLIVETRWAPHLASPTALLLEDANQGQAALRSDGAAQGGAVDGIPVRPTVRRAANGNVIEAQSPLPPLPQNPCASTWAPVVR